MLSTFSRRAFVATKTAKPGLLTQTARPATAFAVNRTRYFHQSSMMASSIDHPVAVLESSHARMLPDSSSTLFAAKKSKKLTFEQIGKELGRDEVAVAALFYGQAKANEEDVKKLSNLLEIPHDKLADQLYGLPDRGRSIEMPPKEPLMYRLYEIVQNYGYAYKAVINEKFGDGIMSAISYSTKVEKDTDEKGEWVVITMRGKWLPYTRF